MALRAVAARWFELLTAREELAAVLRCLAATRAVELQSHSDLSAAHLLPLLRVALDEYRQLSQRYAHYWPEVNGATLAAERHQPPEQLAEGALRQLRAWAAAGEPLIERLRQIGSEQSELVPLQQLLSRPQLPLPDLTLFSGCGPVLASRAYALAPQTGAVAVPPGVLIERIAGGADSFVLALGAREQINNFDDQLSLLKARRITLPQELPPGREAALGWISARSQTLAAESQHLQGELRKLHEAHGVGAALAAMDFIEWLVSHVPELAVTENFAWVTGWTSDATGTAIENALRRADLQHLLRFTAAPAGMSRPIVLRNPRWLQPFELFSRLLGTPAEGEADPSVFVALLAPLMFGFMFGDVGQGAVLIVAGLALRRRYPATALLISGGVAAVAFGFAFGSVFCREVLPPLWLRPIDHPLTLLATSLAFGGCVIIVGLLLEALQYLWSGQARLWWTSRAGLLVSYLVILAVALRRLTLWALPAGLAWMWIGAAVNAPAAQRWQRLGAAVGESFETLLQLLVNTVSFVRVGAFALAHAGLAAAINAMVAGISNRPLGYLVLAVGNLVIIAIEGLVVGIQTTRLILFEFFIRFLKAAGRPFRPLPLPTGTTRHA
jgi:V/A-type H+-transporting ATPase subunit I